MCLVRHIKSGLLMEDINLFAPHAPLPVPEWPPCPLDPRPRPISSLLTCLTSHGDRPCSIPSNLTVSSIGRTKSRPTDTLATRPSRASMSGSLRVLPQPLRSRKTGPAFLLHAARLGQRLFCGLADTAQPCALIPSLFAPFAPLQLHRPRQHSPRR